MLTATLFELWDSFRSARLRRRAMIQLSTLDDRLLNDIGLHRSGIHAAVESALQAREAGRRPRENAAPQPLNGACAVFGGTTP